MNTQIPWIHAVNSRLAEEKGVMGVTYFQTGCVHSDQPIIGPGQNSWFESEGKGHHPLDNPKEPKVRSKEAHTRVKHR